MEPNDLAATIASVLGSIGLLIAGLRYIIKLENTPILLRLEKMESQLELALERSLNAAQSKARPKARR
jgi:hypothetical protein